MEAASARDVQKFATTTDELNPYVLRLVPYEDVPSILYVKNPFSLEGKEWVRITGRGKGWSVYKGDIGMVVQHQGNKIVLMIPRIKMFSSNDRRRPDQARHPAHVLSTVFGEDSIKARTVDGSFTFKGRSYTKEGFLYCSLNEVEISRPADDMPTSKELDIFRGCSLMNEDTLARTMTWLGQTMIDTGTRVIVVQGEFRGLLGWVTEVGTNEVSVFIESLDHIAQVLKSAVRATFRIGDEVRVCNGTHAGSIGWVVDVQQQTITIVNVDKDIEVFARLEYL